MRAPVASPFSEGYRMGNFAHFSGFLDDDLINRFENGKPSATKSFHLLGESQTAILARIIEGGYDFVKTLDFDRIPRLEIKISGWRFFLWTA